MKMMNMHIRRFMRSLDQDKDPDSAFRVFFFFYKLWWANY